jgi:hypothetical protein
MRDSRDDRRECRWYPRVARVGDKLDLSGLIRMDGGVKRVFHLRNRAGKIDRNPAFRDPVDG